MSDLLAPIIKYFEYIHKLEKAGFNEAATIYVYMGIDLMCLLELPVERSSQTRSDFIEWADKYMKADKDQPYQYNGKDLYAARCAMLHAYGSESDGHAKDADIKMYAYTDGGRHHFDPSVNSRLVLIGMRSLIYDFMNAFEAWISDVKSNEEIRENIASRVSKVLMPIPL